MQAEGCLDPAVEAGCRGDPRSVQEGCSRVGGRMSDNIGLNQAGVTVKGKYGPQRGIVLIPGSPPAAASAARPAAVTELPDGSTIFTVTK